MLRLLTLGLLMAGSLTACHAPVPPAAVAADHSLTVVVRHESARRVQAVMADVERLAVEVQASVTIVKFIDKAAFAAGQTTLTFTGLLSPQAVITVKALDAEGRVIGHARQNATVVAGQPIVVDMAVALEPTHLTPADPSGGLTTAITFDSLPTVGTIATTFPATGEALTVDSTGHPWVMGYQTLTRYSPSGATLLTLSANGRSAIAADGGGHVWAADNTRLIKHDANGQALVTKTLTAHALAVDAQDSVWAASGPILRKLSADGTVLWELNLGGSVSRVAVDRQTGIGWVAQGPSFDTAHQLIRVSPDGVRLGETTLLPPNLNRTDLAIDAAGHAWATVMAPLLAPGGRPVFQLAADGDLVGNHQAGVMANAVAIDKTGHAWVTSSSAYANNLSRLSPQGARVGVNSIEGSPRDIAVAPNGDLWILSDSRLTKLVP
jgi:hypothetical protein